MKGMGSRIAALRKQKGMTQERLAEAVGVSAPAVSKWETENSYPDIALLCPLARALGTDVNGLLQFREQMEADRLQEEIKTVAETARKEGVSQALERLSELLREYPSDCALQFQAAAMLLSLEMFHCQENSALREQIREKRRALLEKVRSDATPAYWQQAVTMLAADAMGDGRLDEAEKLLKELPDQVEDTTLLWAQLYTKRAQREKAQEMLEKKLFLHIRQAENCLIMLLYGLGASEKERALTLCERYRGLEELFHVAIGMENGALMETYLRFGEKEKAMACLTRLAQAMADPPAAPDPAIFPTMQALQKPVATLNELRRAVYQALQTDEAFEPYRDDPAYREALERLRPDP